MPFYLPRRNVSDPSKNTGTLCAQRQMPSLDQFRNDVARCRQNRPAVVHGKKLGGIDRGAGGFVIRQRRRSKLFALKEAIYATSTALLGGLLIGLFIETVANMKLNLISTHWHQRCQRYQR